MGHPRKDPTPAEKLKGVNRDKSDIINIIIYHVKTLHWHSKQQLLLLVK